jgi:hypothetical protein
MHNEASRLLSVELDQSLHNTHTDPHNSALPGETELSEGPIKEPISLCLTDTHAHTYTLTSPSGHTSAHSIINTHTYTYCISAT